MTMKHCLSRGALAMGLAIAVLGAASPAGAQDVDPRWLPWIGCWSPTAEDPALELVCVRPAQQQGAVELLRLSENAVTAREVLWADGARHDTSRETCTGWEQGTFSQDGRRLFLKGEFTCEGVTQQTAGVIAMASPAAWIDVRVAGMGGESVAWVQRYNTATTEATDEAGFGDLLADRAWSVATARMVAAGSMDVDDIIEASANVPDEAVQALLAERGDRFELDAAELVRMEAAGVSGDVIDVAVAVSYPRRFQLDTGRNDVDVSALDTGSLRRRPRTAYGVGPAFYDPFYMPWSLRYGYFGYGYGYGYSPYSWGSYGGYGYPFGYRPTVVVVDHVDSGPRGRVVNGRGYTRGGGGASSGGSGGYVPSRSGAGGSVGGSTGGSGSGSGGTSTGRTAKPRGGGS